MSTLVTSNISDGTTSVGTEYVVNGSARSWVSLNGVGTISLNGSFNVSSITDLGTGVYDATVTNAFANDDYGVGTALSYGTGTAQFVRNDLATTTVYRFQGVNLSGAAADAGQAKALATGDLA